MSRARLEKWITVLTIAITECTALMQDMKDHDVFFGKTLG